MFLNPPLRSKFPSRQSRIHQNELDGQVGTAGWTAVLIAGTKGHPTPILDPPPDPSREPGQGLRDSIEVNILSDRPGQKGRPS